MILRFQRLWRHYDHHRYSTYYVNMHPIITAFITSLWSLWLQHPHVTMISIATTSNTSPWSLLLQHLLHHYNLYAPSIYNVNMISTATAFITSLWSLLLQHILQHIPIATASTMSLCLYYYKHLLRLYDPYYYNIYHATRISIATAPNMSQCIMIYYRPHGLISMLSNE